MNETEKYYNNLLVISGYFPTFFLLAPILLACWKWKQLTLPLRFFFWFCFWLLVFNVLVLLFIWSYTEHQSFWKSYLGNWGIENVLFSRIVFYFNDFIFLGYSYFLVLLPNKSKRFHYLLIALLCLLSCVIYVFVDGYQNYGSVGQIFKSVFVLIIVGICFWQLFTSKNTKHSIRKQPFFWINLGLLIPVASTILFESVGDLLFQNDFVVYCKWHILNNAIEILGQIFFIIAFWKAKPLSRD